MEERVNMKKAVILTFSKVYNRGANMQCYALMKTLEKMGCDVEFLGFDHFDGDFLVLHDENSSHPWFTLWYA